MGDPASSLLERRYRRLLFAYPAAYRADRGDEIVATLLDLAGPGRRTPRLADTVDLIASGIRRRVGTAALAGFDAGLTVAAPVALALAAGISAFAWWRVEPISGSVHIGGSPLFGVFRTLGPIAYGCWLIAAAGRAMLRPAAGRILIVVAILVTVVLPALAPLTGVDRPPLWVLMALVAFGLLALAGTGHSSGASATPSADERLGVPTGAIAVAVCASAVMVMWPPMAGAVPGGGFGYYYQPTIARVGTVVAATVAVLAVISVGRLVRHLDADQWLWATVLLGLPAGWLGPFDTASVRIGSESGVPHFGRLAQVLLASCLASVAIVWLAHRRSPGYPAPHAPDLGTLSTAGSVAVGSALGLAAFVVLGGFGLVGFVGEPLRDGLPPYVGATLAVLLLVALCARPWRSNGWLGLACGLGGSLVSVWLVASYDNGWTTAAWADFARTTDLVATLAFGPLSLCALVAARVLAAQRRGRMAAIAVLVVCVGWLGYVTIPYVFSWGPVLLVLISCCVVLAFSGRGRTGSAPAT